MIINTQNDNIEVIGDIQEFKTGIDAKNLEFITTLLSSNLYSHPEQSFIREIVSNAWDSQVEAGTTDIPILIDINEGEKTITIRDYGVGLSPERFKNIYCNIGSSTKRESNDFIGGFGIGRFSALACTNTVYITSYYEGKAYHYIMIKNGNYITTNLVATLPTSERNGVEVKIKELVDIFKYKDALYSIVFFPNIYVNYKHYITNINDIKIKKFSHFCCASEIIEDKILLGNVLYPLDTSQLSIYGSEFIRNIRATGIVLRFNVGDLEITPNRENIIYSKNSIATIEQKIVDAKKELNTLAESVFHIKYDNIIEYINASNSDIFYDIFSNSIHYYNKDRRGYCNINYPASYLYKNLVSLKYKGKVLPYSDLRNLTLIYKSKFTFIKGVFYKNKYYNSIKSTPIAAEKYQCLNSSTVLRVPENTRMTWQLRDYITSKYNSCLIISKFEEEELKHKMQKCTQQSLTPEQEEYIKDLYNEINSEIIDINPDTDKEFLKYKDSLKSESSPVKRIKEIVVHVYSPSYRKYTFTDEEELYTFIKKTKKGIVLSKYKENTHYDITTVCQLGYLYMEVNKVLYDVIIDKNFTNIMTLKQMIKKNKTVSKLYTASLYRKSSRYEEYRYDILQTLPKEYRKCIQSIDSIYGVDVSGLISICTPNVDAFVAKSITIYEDCRDKWLLTYNILSKDNIKSTKIVNLILFKNRAYKMDYEMVKNIVNSFYYKQLCIK